MKAEKESETLTDGDDRESCEEGCNIGGQIHVQQREELASRAPLPYCDSSCISVICLRSRRKKRRFNVISYQQKCTFSYYSLIQEIYVAATPPTKKKLSLSPRQRGEEKFCFFSSRVCAAREGERAFSSMYTMIFTKSREKVPKSGSL
jgi:hypothetical protein